MSVLALAPEEFKSLVDEVWASLLVPVPVDADRVNGEAATFVAGFVEIQGGWVGRVSVETTDRGAVAIASQMLMVPSEELTQADLVDAVGELANIVGGSVKSCVEGHSTLSLPAVVPVDEVGGHEAQLEVVSQWQEHPLRVRVLAVA
jgi:chemotaxis protein CheX